VAGADGQTSSDFADDPNVMAARSDAGVGIGSNCQIPRAGQKGSLGDIGRFHHPNHHLLRFSFVYLKIGLGDGGR